MPVFEVTAPDGKKLRVTAPEGATQEQALAKAREMYQPEQASQPERTAEPEGYISKDPTARQYGRTAFDNVMQGATLGFSDEITDRIGALGASLMSDQSYGDLLKEARRSTKERQAEQLNEMPVTTIGSQLAGALMTGKAAGGTKAGQAFARGTGKAADKVGGLLRSGKVGRNALQDMLTAAPASAGYAIGTAEDGQRFTGDTLRDTALGIGTAGLASAAASKILPKLSRTKAPKVTSETLRQDAGKLYQKAAQKGGVLKAQFTDDFLQRAADDLIPKDEVIRNMKASRPLMDAFDDISQLKGQPLTLDRAQALDEVLGDMIDAHVQPNGRVNKVGKKILDVQSSLREMIEGAAPDMVEDSAEGFEALKQARKAWSQSRKMADIEKIITRAEMMEQPATGIKTGFRTLLMNPMRMRGYTDAERKAIEKAAKTGVVQDLFRMFGSRLVPIGAAVSGSGVGGTAAAAAANAASRGIGTKMQVQKGLNVAKTIANQGRTPQKQIGPSLTELLTRK